MSTGAPKAQTAKRHGVRINRAECLLLMAGSVVCFDDFEFGYGVLTVAANWFLINYKRSKYTRDVCWVLI